MFYGIVYSLIFSFLHALFGTYFDVIVFSIVAITLISLPFLFYAGHKAGKKRVEEWNRTFKGTKFENFGPPYDL